jgi:hypothetical protein
MVTNGGDSVLLSCNDKVRGYRGTPGITDHAKRFGFAIDDITNSIGCATIAARWGTLPEAVIIIGIRLVIVSIVCQSNEREASFRGAWRDP